MMSKSRLCVGGRGLQRSIEISHEWLPPSGCELEHGHRPPFAAGRFQSQQGLPCQAIQRIAFLPGGREAAPMDPQYELQTSRSALP